MMNYITTKRDAIRWDCLNIIMPVRPKDTLEFFLALFDGWGPYCFSLPLIKLVFDINALFSGVNKLETQ